MISEQDFIKKYRDPAALRLFLVSIVDRIEDDRKTHKLNKLFEGDLSRLQDAYQEVFNLLVNDDLNIDMKLLNALYVDFGRYTARAENKRKGRPPVTDKVDIDKITAAFKQFRSVRKAAKVLGLSHPTVSKQLKEAGIDVDSPGGSYRKGTKRTREPHTGKVANWVRDNPDTPLPTDPKEIAELTGASVLAVKAYLNRRKADLEDQVALLPDIRKTDLCVKIGEEVLKAKHLESYIIEVVPITLRICIKGYNSVGTLVEWPALDYKAIKDFLRS